jgi:hypothetical protein
MSPTLRHDSAAGIEHTTDAFAAGQPFAPDRPARRGLSSQRRLTWLMACLIACSCWPVQGCNYVVPLALMISGPPTIEPEFDALTKESMTDKDVTVAVVCFAPTDVRFSFENVDNELARYVTFRLYEHKIKVISPDHVKGWLDENKDWDRPEEIGAAFKCTYVIYIDLNTFSLYEEGSANLYRGRAEAIVSVWKMDESHEEGDKIFSKEVISKYPIHQPISTGEVTYSNFKGQYLSRFAEEIGRLFYEYFSGDDIGAG